MILARIRLQGQVSFGQTPCIFHAPYTKEQNGVLQNERKEKDGKSFGVDSMGLRSTG